MKIGKHRLDRELRRQAAALGLLLLVIRPAYSQQPPAGSEATPAPVEQVVVTGSRIASPNQVSTRPIQVISSAAIIYNARIPGYSYLDLEAAVAGQQGAAGPCRGEQHARQGSPDHQLLHHRQRHGQHLQLLRHVRTPAVRRVHRSLLTDTTAAV